MNLEPKVVDRVDDDNVPERVAVDPLDQMMTEESRAAYKNIQQQTRKRTGRTMDHQVAVLRSLLSAGVVGVDRAKELAWDLRRLRDETLAKELAHRAAAKAPDMMGATSTNWRDYYRPTTLDDITRFEAMRGAPDANIWAMVGDNAKEHMLYMAHRYGLAPEVVTKTALAEVGDARAKDRSAVYPIDEKPEWAITPGSVRYPGLGEETIYDPRDPRDAWVIRRRAEANRIAENDFLPGVVQTMGRLASRVLPASYKEKAQEKVDALYARLRSPKIKAATIPEPVETEPQPYAQFTGRYVPQKSRAAYKKWHRITPGKHAVHSAEGAGRTDEIKPTGRITVRGPGGNVTYSGSVREDPAKPVMDYLGKNIGQVGPGTRRGFEPAQAPGKSSEPGSFENDTTALDAALHSFDPKVRAAAQADVNQDAQRSYMQRGVYSNDGTLIAPSANPVNRFNPLRKDAPSYRQLKGQRDEMLFTGGGTMGIATDKGGRTRKTTKRSKR